MMLLYPFEESKTMGELALVLRGKFKCCWFLGAGVSKIAGYPLWEELVTDMIGYFQANQDKIKSIEGQRKFQELIMERKSKLVVEGEFKGDPVEVLTILKNCDQELFNERIKKIFNKCEKSQNDQIFEIISRFIKRNKNSVIITTNIDKGLQNCLNLPDEQVTILGANPVKMSTNSKIIYLHGRIDYPDTWVFTESEYTKAYGEPAHVKEFLSKFLKTIDVLIVLGYSFRERDIIRVFSGKEIRIYWITRCEDESNLETRWRILEEDMRLRIKLIPYKPIDDHYLGLCQLLEGLYKKAYPRVEWEERP